MGGREAYHETHQDVIWAMPVFSNSVFFFVVVVVVVSASVWMRVQETQERRMRTTEGGTAVTNDGIQPASCPVSLHSRHLNSQVDANNKRKQTLNACIHTCTHYGCRQE